MPLSPEKIAMLRKKVNDFKTDNEKISFIATLTPKKIIPVLIQIIIDACDKQNDNVVTSKDAIFLEYAKKLLEDADDKQNTSFLRVASMLSGLDKTQILDGLDTLVKHCQAITITEDSKLVWLEASWWLEGIYQDTYDKVPKDENGQPVKSDDGLVRISEIEDRLFSAAVGLSKYSIAEYYHKVANIIKSKLDNQQVLQPEEKQKAAGFLIFNAEKRTTRFRVKFNLPLEHENKLPAIEKAIANIISGVEKQSSPLMQIQSVPEVQEYKTLPALLQAYQGTNHNLRFAILFYGLENYPLTDDEKMKVRMFAQNAKAEIAAYSNAYFTTYGVPTYFWRRTHTSSAKQAISNINSDADATDNLFTIYELWQKTKSRNSQALYPKITALLDDVYNLLLTHQPSEKLAGLK